jgi:predicted transcriptional regulator
LSYQAVRTYLTDHRGVEYSRTDDRLRTDVAGEQIEQFRNRLITVTRSKLEQLDNADAIVLDEPQVTVDVQVLCEACGERSDVSTLLSEEWCTFDS